MDSKKTTQKEEDNTTNQQADSVTQLPPEGSQIVASKPIWSGWRYVFIALGILIELMAAGLLLFLILIVPEIDLIGILLFCVPFIGFAGGIFVIYASRWLK